MKSPRLALLTIVISSALSGCSFSSDAGSEDPAPSPVAATPTVTVTAPPAVAVTAPPTVTEPSDTKADGKAMGESGPEAQLPIEGTWSGNVHQDGVDGYSVRVTFDGIRDLADALVEYPELGCGGQWEMDDVSQSVYSFTESITYGSSCIDGIEIAIDASNENELRFETLPPYESSAILTKDHGSPVGDRQSLDAEELGWPTEADDASSALMIWFGAAWRVGESSIGFPEWVSCTEKTELCIAGSGSTVGVIERRSDGFYEVAAIESDRQARRSLLELGYADEQVDALLSVE